MLSKKTQYALRAMSYLGARYNKGPIQIIEIAKNKNIPLKFLEVILLELKIAGVLDSKKGKGGGYFLPEKPEKTALAKIIRTVNGPIAMLPCVSLYFYEKCPDCDEKVCHINRTFAEARDAVLKVLEKRTVKDII